MGYWVKVRKIGETDFLTIRRMVTIKELSENVYQ